MSEDSQSLEARRAALLNRLDGDGDTLVQDAAERKIMPTVWSPVCAAETIDTHLMTKGEVGYFFRDLKWSCNGRHIFAIRAERTLYHYEVPMNFFEKQQIMQRPKYLCPTSSYCAPMNISAIATPWYLDNKAVCLVSCVDLPIRLLSFKSPFEESVSEGGSYNSVSSLGSYPVINKRTEVYQHVYSLLSLSREIAIQEDIETSDHVLWAGSTSTISKFDLSRPNEPPMWNIFTNSTADEYKVYGQISALAATRMNNTLAAGTFQRRVGLYDNRSGAIRKAWSLCTPLETELEKGDGVTSLNFNYDGNYLYIAERMANVIQVWDMRKDQRLGLLAGREAMTKQRMGVSLIPSYGYDGKSHVFATDTSGNVQIYEDPPSTLDGGVMYPTHTFDAHNDAAAAIAHKPRSRAVLATASGQRSFPPTDTDISSSESSSNSSTAGSDADEAMADGNDKPDQEETSSDVQTYQTQVPRGEHKLKLWLTPGIDFSPWIKTEPEDHGDPTGSSLSHVLT